jgi:hypothetical protein
MSEVTDQISVDNSASAVDGAVLAAQAQGKPKLDEMIFTLDREIAIHRSSMRAGIIAYGRDKFDLTGWGRKVYVLEALLDFLVKMNGDDQLKQTIRERLTLEGPARVERRRPRIPRG